MGDDDNPVESLIDDVDFTSKFVNNKFIYLGLRDRADDCAS
jgi:hypothetical protein